MKKSSAALLTAACTTIMGAGMTFSTPNTIPYFGVKIDVAGFIRDDLTLDKIETKGVNSIIVISENPLGGKVYRYGNHGKFWEQIGTVCGYA